MDQQSDQAWLSVVLPENLKRWVRVEAAMRDMSASAFVRNLVEREMHESESSAVGTRIGSDRGR
jgi:hypothetical protein